MKFSKISDEVIYRGQLYKGDRNKEVGERFAFGNATYFTSHFGDASGYAKADMIQNMDLQSHLDLESKVSGIPYSELKERVMQKGDGVVYAHSINTEKALRIGEGRMFNLDTPESLEQISKALASAGLDQSKIAPLVRYITKNNDNPNEVMSRLTRDNLGSMLTHYAREVGADCLVMGKEITPVRDALKNRCEHIIVINDEITKLVTQSKPLDRPLFFGLPNEDFDKYEADFVQFLADCKARMREINTTALKQRIKVSNMFSSEPFISHRGQLYNGTRSKGYGAEYGFGDGEYYSGFSVASTYASDDESINIDLTGNLKHIADLYGEDIEGAKSIVAPNGTGVVVSSLIAPRKMITFGGEQFVVIDEEAKVRQRLNLALSEIDKQISTEKREEIIDFIIENNDNPIRVMQTIASEGVGDALRQYASILLCDAFKIDAKIAPNHALHSSAPNGDADHYVVLDDSIVKNIATNEPILMEKDLYSPVLMSTKERDDAIEAHLSECISKSNEIQQQFGMAFSITQAVQVQQASENQLSDTRAKRAALKL